MLFGVLFGVLFEVLVTVLVTQFGVTLGGPGGGTGAFSGYAVWGAGRIFAMGVLSSGGAVRGAVVQASAWFFASWGLCWVS